LSHPLSVREVLNKCEAALDASEWVDVGFAWQVRLWAAIRREYGEEGIFRIISYDVECDISFGDTVHLDLGDAPSALPAAHAAAFDVRGKLEDVYTEAFLPTVWDDAHYEQCKEEDCDWEWWGAAYWASIVVGGLKGIPSFAPSARRSFWLHWLHEEVPFCLGKVGAIKRRIASVEIET